MLKTKTAPQTSELSKFFIFILFILTFALCTLHFALQPQIANAQVPQLRLPCTDTKEPDFHSLRPDQAAPCGDANKALYCSNDLIFIEDFNMVGKNDCHTNRTTRDFDCSPNWKVPDHVLRVQLDNSQFPIEGNTELVKNSQQGSDSIDDATKVNEYVSWYLSGVNGRAEYGVPTNDQIINYSGPLKKLLPGAIQDAARSDSIEKATKTTKFSDEGDITGAPAKIVNEPETHNQVVVCANKTVNLLPSWLTNFFGLGAVGLGKITPSDCPNGSEYRLKDWNESPINTAVDGARPYISKILSGNILTSILSDVLVDRWSKKTPPLPWKDATGKPFVSSNAYLKAYKEWRGDWCAMIPNPFNNSSSFLGGPEFPICVGIPGVTNNEYADLFQYVPLTITPDKKGAEWVPDVIIKPSNGTELAYKSYDLPRSAPLYFAHTKETLDATNLLNTTYTPKDYKSQPVPETTEKNECSIVNIRTNPGDNLFPGDPDEIQIPGVTYFISKTACHEVFTPGVPTPCGPGNKKICKNDKDDITCNAEVIITIPTGTKTPYADQIFSSAVADSGSTFRKIYPEVSENAPITCIADIPTITGVEYDPSKSDLPEGGTQEFKVKDIPGDGGGEGHHLAFPHIGSLYEYFLKGIQTALRPKGYADPIADGQLCFTDMCKPVTGLPKASGSCALGGSLARIGTVPPTLKAVVEAAAQTYKVPPSLILGVMYGESVFNTNFYKNEANVKDFASCRPLPNCNANSSTIKSIVPFIQPYWDNLAKDILPDLKKIDPKKTKADPCNLLDATFGLAKDLHDNAGGSASMTGNSCYGIKMTSTNPGSCSWDNSQYETAIRVWEIGTEYDVAARKTCLTTAGTCANGLPSGPADPNDPDKEGTYTSGLCKGGDNCEKLGSSGNTSHNACVFEVSTSGGSGNKN